MSRKGSPTIVGFFVIGALTVAAAAGVFLGNIAFDDEHANCVLFFQTSLHGLSEGASVTYRGVRVGQVSDIAITFEPEASKYRTPVYVIIDSENLGHPPGFKILGKSSEKQFLQDMIDRGLRAKLEMKSLVTGQLYIDLDFYPETQVRLRGVEGDYLEIPTLPSQMEQLTKALANLELDSLINRAVDALDNLNHFLTSEETERMAGTFFRTIEHLDSLILNADKSIPQLVSDFGEIAENINHVSEEFTRSLESGRKELGPVAADLRKTLASVDEAAAGFVAASENIRNMTEQDSRFSYELNNSLKEVGKAADAVRGLADLLQRNPELLLYGPREKRK